MLKNKYPQDAGAIIAFIIFILICLITLIAVAKISHTHEIRIANGEFKRSVR